ncbi:MAG: RpiB/LacA/LacB family sugar-phosphate isomerase [Planctomycetaceae bacterium]
MSSGARLSCAIGGDHAGYELKSYLAAELREGTFEVFDCGAHDETPSDFPDFAEKVAEQVLSGKVERGILVCGSGVGVCVAANKIPGIRAGCVTIPTPRIREWSTMT